MDWLTHIIADRWFTAFIAFFLGLITGWLLSKGRKTGEETENGHAGAIGGPASGAPPSMKLGALEAEIKNIKTLLEAKEVDDELTAETLSSLDEAIKRANGRLKLIVKTVKKAKTAE